MRLKIKIIKKIKDTGCPLLISVDIDQETEKLKKGKHDRTGTKANKWLSITNNTYSLKCMKNRKRVGSSNAKLNH